MPQHSRTQPVAPPQPNFSTSLNTTRALQRLQYSLQFKPLQSPEVITSFLILSILLVPLSLDSRIRMTFSSEQRIAVLRVQYPLTLLRQFCCRICKLVKHAELWRTGS